MVETHPLPQKKQDSIRKQLVIANTALIKAKEATERYSQLRLDVANAIEHVEEALDRLD